MLAKAKILQFVMTAWAVGDGPGQKLRLLWRQTANVRARLHLKRFRPERVFTIRTHYGPLHFRDNFGDVTNVHDLLWKQVYRTDTPLGAGCIFDVGANVGLAAAYFAREHPGRPIHCFEPLSANAALIRRNCPAAVVTTAAVGEVAGSIMLRADVHQVMASSIDTPWETEPFEFPVITLDDYAHTVGDVALMKIDVEGMELAVLRGAECLLRRTGQVVLETHGRERHDAVLARLRAAGFHILRDEFGGHTGIVAAKRQAAG